MIDDFLNKRFNYDSAKIKEYKIFLYNHFDFDINKIRDHLNSFDVILIKLDYLGWLNWDGTSPARYTAGRCRAVP